MNEFRRLTPELNQHMHPIIIGTLITLGRHA
jgi:hypothetical protein